MEKCATFFVKRIVNANYCISCPSQVSFFTNSAAIRIQNSKMINITSTIDNNHINTIYLTLYLPCNFSYISNAKQG